MLLVLAIPVALAILPLVVPRRRATLAAAVMLTAFSVVAGFSIGVFLVPTAVVAWIANAASKREARDGSIVHI